VQVYIFMQECMHSEGNMIENWHLQPMVIHGTTFAPKHY